MSKSRVNKSRYLAVAVGLLALLPVLANAGDGEQDSAGQDTLARIRQAFPYDPSAKRNREERSASDEDVVAMGPYTVEASMVPRWQREGIERATRERLDSRFSFIRGGTVFGEDLGKVRMDVGPSFSRSGLSFLRFSW